MAKKKVIAKSKKENKNYLDHVCGECKFKTWYDGGNPLNRTVNGEYMLVTCPFSEYRNVCSTTACFHFEGDK